MKASTLTLTVSTVCILVVEVICDCNNSMVAELSDAHPFGSLTILFTCGGCAMFDQCGVIYSIIHCTM